MARRRRSLVIEAARGNLFHEKDKQNVRRGALKRQLKKDLTAIGRGMLFMGPKRKRRRRR